MGQAIELSTASLLDAALFPQPTKGKGGRRTFIFTSFPEVQHWATDRNHENCGG